ncbi:MAG: hypothetical protein R2744_12560 [Bacteroidales bacterium]
MKFIFLPMACGRTWQKAQDEFQILSVDPDTIYFEYERGAFKRVVVEPVVEVRH